MMSTTTASSARADARAAIVTGASRGIGRAIALRLARDGFDVAVNFAGNAGLAAQTVAAVEACGRHAIAIRADVSDPEAVRKLFDAASDAFGRLDAVVHNAGAMTLAPVAPENVQVLDRMLAVNLRGAFLVLGEAAQRMAEGGRIIALSTSAIGKSLPGYGAYIAAKSGVEGLVRVMANEMRGRGITVNAVAPGPVGTELFLDGKTPEQVAQLAQAAPLERLGEPEDIAGVVAFLAGTDGGWVNGQVVRANGGFV